MGDIYFVGVPYSYLSRVTGSLRVPPGAVHVQLDVVRFGDEVATPVEAEETRRKCIDSYRFEPDKVRIYKVLGRL